jgi:phosphoribosylanthranilate isomerase
MVKIKICGITNEEDALNSVKSGCAALGFVFYKKSPRYISPGKAGEIIKGIPKNIFKAGVFVNSPKGEVKKIAKLCGLDILQFHGDESADFCSQFVGYKTIKAFRLKKGLGLKDIKEYRTFAYLFDTYSREKLGGTGKAFDWKLLKGLHKIKKPVFLAGGLTAKNVAAAIKRVRPDWVDVSSSVEIRPGKKGLSKIKKFIETIRKSAL